MKKILTVSLVAVLCALMVLGTLQSILGAFLTFAVVLCLGLYPQDFGFGREKTSPAAGTTGNAEQGQDTLTQQERDSFIDIPEYKDQ